MRKRITVTAVIASGAVITALIVTPSIVFASQNAAAPERGATTHTSAPPTSGQPSDGSNKSGKSGMHQGREKGTGAHKGAAHGAGKGSAGSLSNIASGTVTAEQTAVLTHMAEEEKLAHDLYVAFDEMYDAPVFSRIAGSETKHLDSVQVLLERYDIIDPTAGQMVGVFRTDATQELYDTLLAQGSVSLDAAREAARTVEEMDIADLTAAMDGVTAPDVLAVYGHLRTASKHHLVAFGG